MSDERKYVRVYYSVVDDERFADVFHDARRLGTWLQLLLVADAMYPAAAPIPAYVHRQSFVALVAAGLIDEKPHKHYCIHGLASERGIRSQSARNAAASRWQSERSAEPMPRQDEHRQDKTSSTRAMRETNGRKPVLIDEQTMTLEERSARYIERQERLTGVKA